MVQRILDSSTVKKQARQAAHSRKETLIMLGRQFHQFLDNLIREHAHITTDGYSLHAHNLSLDDKKLFLTYLTTIEDYEYFTENPRREQIAVQEYEPHMQYLIDDRLGDLYNEDMQEFKNYAENTI